MALTATTLAGAKTTNSTFIVLTSATGAARKMLALVDAEWMRITSADLTPTLQVVPGYNGSTAGPHGILAPVIYGNPQDFVSAGVVPGTVITSQSFGVSGAVTGPSGAGVPISNTLIYITKATAAAMTLAAAAIDQQNTLTFISTTAAAHTITMAGNAAGTDVATFAAEIGTSCTMKASNGVWACIAQNGVTVA